MSKTFEPLTPTEEPRAAEARGIDVLLLSVDLHLYSAIREVIGHSNKAWLAHSPAEAVDVLLAGRGDVLIVDLAQLESDPEALVRQIVAQFPDIVICAAGSRSDEATIKALISEGLVYRFLHRPLSPKRTELLIGSALQRYVQLNGQNVSAEERRAAQAEVVELKRKPDKGKWLFVGASMSLVGLLLATISVDHRAKSASGTNSSQLAELHKPGATTGAAQTPAGTDKAATPAGSARSNSSMATITAHQTVSKLTGATPAGGKPSAGRRSGTVGTEPAARQPAQGSIIPIDSLQRTDGAGAVYPPEALRAGVSGWVELEFTVTEDGRVTDVAVSGAEPRGVFERSATTAVATWRFQPREVNGRAVAQRSSVRLRYDIER